MVDENEKATLGPQKISSRQHMSALWVGGMGGMEAELVKRAGIPYREIPAAGVHGVGLRRLPGNIKKLWQGYRASRSIIREYCPDVMFFTGGYVAVPMALAGRFLGKKMRRPHSVLYVPDIEPGLALKTLAYFSDRIAITAQESAAHLPRRDRLSVTGYPIRPELSSWIRKPDRHEKALSIFQLSSRLPVLLVFGGSKGARSINRALMAVLPELLPEMQVIHICGQLDWPEVEANHKRLGTNLVPEYTNRYRVYPYLHEEMGAALAVADLVVSRSGASVLGEFPLFGLPAILAPYPYAWHYQMVNARYLERHGAAVIMEDLALPDKILEQVQTLIRDKSRLDSMRQAMLALSDPHAAQKIVELVRSMAPAGGGEQ
jgi:UDP-N-acetylglucosamine--N-acetylmuramyl-(pentapeptide) pyrophosphoryl-undecaprenol N-acetylglucosamine transferase